MAAPHRAAPLDEADREKIRRLVVEGLTRPQIAYRMGVSRGPVERAIAQMGGVEAIRAEAEERRRKRLAAWKTCFTRLRKGE